jgi:hypothetical protein
MIDLSLEDVLPLHTDIDDLIKAYPPVKLYQAINDLSYAVGLAKNYKDIRYFLIQIKNSKRISHQIKNMLLYTSIDDMPMKLNHKSPLIRMIAKWRLRIGK